MWCAGHSSRYRPVQQSLQCLEAVTFDLTGKNAYEWREERVVLRRYERRRGDHPRKTRCVGFHRYTVYMACRRTAPHRAEDTRLSLTQQQLSNVCEFVAIDCAQSPSRCDAISSTWTRCRHNVAERKCVACSWQRDLLQARSTRRQLPLQCLF